MRVLTFLHSFEPGGVERDALRLNAEWKRLGVDTQLVMGRADGPLSTDASGLAYHVLQTGRISTAAFETLWMTIKLPAAIRTLKPDALFCAGNTYSIVAVAMRIWFGKRCPPIAIKVSNDLNRFDLPAPMRWAYHLWLRAQSFAFDAVIAMADPARDEIATIMRVSPDRIHMIENAPFRRAELARFGAAADGFERAHAGRQFLAVGRLALQKNFALLIKAFARIAKPDDRLTIIGEGSQRPALENLAETLGVSDRVAMPGHLFPLYDAFAQADAFVLSSDYEGLVGVVVEALAAGLPIVATNCCATMPMLLEDAGILVPIKDEAALAAAMDTVGVLSVDASTMQARAALFTVERAAPKWIALFAKLTGQPIQPAT